MTTAVFGPILVLPITWSRKLEDLTLVAISMLPINPIRTAIITLVN